MACLKEGRGIEQNYDEAAKYFKLAADKEQVDEILKRFIFQISFNSKIIF